MQEVGHKITVGSNVTIFWEGDSCDGAYIIERGAVEVSINRNGQKVILGKRKAGEVFGEMSIIDDRPRTATITTIEPCELVRITQGHVRSRMEQADPILRMYLGVILKRFRSTLKGLQTIDSGELATPFDSGSADIGAEQGSYGDAINEIKLEKELSQALRDENFELHFQPIIDLHRRALVGFESLIRWRHKKNGLILPNEFIPTAEASGLIVPIGNWVFKHSCEFLRRMNGLFPPAYGARRLFVSINISARSFSAPNFVEEIVAAARESAVSPADIKLEVTETTLFSQPELVAGALRKLKDAGFSIALDDFGTGYSSLSYLHQYPFDTLKIDQSFVRNLHNNPKNNDILASIAALAGHLDLSVVAEGIETREQEQQICELDCAFAQGYFYSRPVSEMEIIQLMESLRLASEKRVAQIGSIRLECA